MVKRAKNTPDKKHYRTYYLQIFWLVLLIIIYRIGEAPIMLLKGLLRTIYTLLLFPFKLLSSRAKVSPRKRGRPRTQPLTSFYLHKLNYNFGRFVPKRSRFKWALALVVMFIFIYSFLLVKVASDLPHPSQIESNFNPLTTQVYDRNGKLLYQFYEGRNRKLIKLEDLPPHLVQATISMEDKNFYHHLGIDPTGMLRAFQNNLKNDGSLEGGSTITQQLIKNTLLTPDKTFTRKIKEVILAFWTERIYSKDEILQAYFNESPYGGPAWGVEAAAEMYFGKSAHNLTLSESSYLAGLPASPTQYSPYGAYPQKARDRQKEVLRRMVEEKYITPDEAQKAYDTHLDIKPPSQQILAPHFVMYVKSILAQKYGERVVSQGGLKVITTLDMEMQEMAQDIVTHQVNQLSSLNVGNGAAVISDAKNGQILAMVGSKDYFDKNDGNFNVTTALRQPGSSFKPITYAAAFAQGYSPGSILLDTPVTFKNAWESYSPVNYDGRFHGAVTIRTSLGSSYNIPAVKTLATVGVSQVVSLAKQMGITTYSDPSKYGLSLTLGGGAVKMVDMISVYNTFASNGIKYEPQPILLVSDSSGNILEDHRTPSGKRVLSQEVAYLVNNVLSDSRARIPAFGSNSLLEIKDHPSVAVKTGTSDDKRDNWVFGYTPEYVVGTWVGNNDNSPMNPRLTSGITGATPIWHDIMIGLLEKRPDIAFTKPNGVIEATVDGRRDLVIAGSASKSMVTTRRTIQKDERGGQDKEVITFTDPYSSLKPDPQKNTTQ